ncbi:MAG: glycosyltransferase [Candidatus Binatia bacterium]|nr:glycosyltransferase [Candidatus Binatia bacterium]
MRPGVDVVVPVFEAREHVGRCIASVLRHAGGDFRLVIVDDASPTPELRADLDRIASEQDRVVLLRNDVNQGFVVSANRGLRHADGRDVVLLNSDTIVTRGFLSKLTACAYEDDVTGIVSPLTNNGTVCSVPRFMEDNEIPASLTVDQFGILIERASRRRRPDLVTAVGFCMFVRHDLIARIGFLDEENFPRGYGEENDYSERAREAGYRIRLCDDLFVAHSGSASFGGETSERQKAHNDVIGQMYPTYHQRVQEFIRENPLADLHRDIHSELDGWERAGFFGRKLRLLGL